MYQALFYDSMEPEGDFSSGKFLNCKLVNCRRLKT